MNHMTIPEWESIYRKYYRRIYDYCLYRIKHEYDAEDMTSEVFCLLYDKWEQYEAHDEAAILSFLYRAANLKIRERGRQTDRPYGGAEIDIDTLSEELPIDYAIVENDRYERYISDILRKLTGQDRELFTYIVIDQLRYTEIADKLHVSENTVKLRWYRLRRRMKPLIYSLIDQ